MCNRHGPPKTKDAPCFFYKRPSPAICKRWLISGINACDTFAELVKTFTNLLHHKMVSGTFTRLFLRKLIDFMNKAWLFGFVAMVASLQGAHSGDIAGTVTLKGTPPPEIENQQIKIDPVCSKMHSGPVKTQFYVVGQNNGLGDCFVTLKGISGKSDGANAAPVVLDQKGCEYVPYIFAVQTGQKIVVKNSDPVMHNVHPMPVRVDAGNKEDNKAQMAGSPPITFTFPAPEVFLKFSCQVHPWMFAYASIVDHPYFAVTDKDGKYTIKNVPDGKYTMEVYHRKAAPISKPVTGEVEVKGGSVTKDFALEVPASK
jgi:plastocyanin